MAQAMFSGNTDKDCYSDIAAYTTDVVLEQNRNENHSVLTVADFGTGDGVGFLKLMTEIVRHTDTKSRSPLQIFAYLDDMPSNDFNLLYSKHAGIMSNKFDKTVFYATIGKSMYSQCLPAESVDIVFSSAAVHWLSKIPCDIKDGLSLIHASLHERELFKQQANEDWKTFLLARGRELKSGGFMVLTVTVSDENDAGRNLMLYTSEVWRKMFINGKISKDEYERTTHGFYTQRTEEDIRQPFTHPDIRSLGLRIVTLESRKHVHIPLKLMRKNSGKYVYSAAVVDVTRPILWNVIYSGLSGNRTADEKNKIVEDFFTVMTDTVTEGSDSFDYFIMKEVVITKE